MGAGVGGRGTTGTAGEVPPAWAVSNSNRSGVFSSSTMSSGMLISSWLVLSWAGGKHRWKGPGRSSGSSWW